MENLYSFEASSSAEYNATVNTSYFMPDYYFNGPSAIDTVGGLSNP